MRVFHKKIYGHFARRLKGSGRRGFYCAARIDVKKAPYDSVDHGWLNGVMLLYRFPARFCRVIAKLCGSWNTRVMIITCMEREGNFRTYKIQQTYS